MKIIQELFGKSPFGPLVEHSKKVHECVELILPLMEALVAEDYEKIHQLQDQVSKLEYEADRIKHSIREHLTRRFFLPVDRADLENFLRTQDKIADSVEDFAVILLIRNTKIHHELQQSFITFGDQIALVSRMLVSATEQLQNLAEVSFSGAEAQEVMDAIKTLGEEEWKADRLARSLSQDIYKLEDTLDPITIIFYEKMLLSLGNIANQAENTGDLLRTMIVNS